MLRIISRNIFVWTAETLDINTRTYVMYLRLTMIIIEINDKNGYKKLLIEHI